MQHDSLLENLWHIFRGSVLILVKFGCYIFVLSEMKRSESEAFAKRVVHFFESVSGRNQIQTCHHFMEEGYRRSTLIAILNRYKERGNIDYKPLSGRRPSVGSKKVVHGMKKLLEKHPDTSVRRGALKVGVSKSTFSRIKREELGMKAYKSEPAPKYTGKQKQRAKSACRKIYRRLLPSGDNKILIIDDETYVPLDPSQIPGDKYYHCKSKSDVSDDIRFKGKEKFTKRFLVWQAIDEEGNISDPYICEGTVNAEIYLEECLKKRLLPFIQKYHKNSNILFWPDLATSHYAYEVQDWLSSEKIEFVKKTENAPNVPQARPIERFWALCKAEYGKRKMPANSLSSFKRIWKNLSTKVARRSAQTLMKGVRKSLRKIAYRNVFEPLKK